jgi:glycosyltransferase involved in cell wall biosynthesis
MEETKGLVSVTIPFFNAERFLRETIESVLAQRYATWELLLVDDGSSDGSSTIAQSYAALHPDKIFYLEHAGHRNLGLPAARNLGARHSRGEFLAFLDADDIWLPAKLEVNVASMVDHPEAGFLFGPTEYWYEWDPEGNGNRKNEVPMVAPGEKLYTPPELLARNMPLGNYGVPCPCSFLVRRWAFKRIGGFVEDFNPTTYQMYEDVAFLSKIYLHVPVYVSEACLDRNRCNRFSMTRQVSTARNFDASRRFFLRWLTDYLRQHAVTDREVWNAVHRESWFYCLPIPVASLLRRAQWRIARSLANKECGP